MIDRVSLKTKCLTLLRDHIGDIETEWFLHDIQTQKQDYTLWQRDYYDAISDDELKQAVQKHIKEHPFEYEKATEFDG